ncbi:MAG: two-component sensor histidine kinase [Deltaproteobacteria bacterium]|nr:two-component sensor histidine kinase [Deltaproteobacteria bacterium]MBW2150851.1 two-component sensor histidine kinase [Deltaproteobacteria bacterium]
MNKESKKPESELIHRLKWIMFLRVIFTALLLSTALVYQVRKTHSFLNEQLLVVYALTVTIFILSFIYTLVLPRVKRELLFTYVQIVMDTFVVTMIIFLTGGYSSIFSFLYMVVIIYASMLLFRRGSMIMASLCSIQYGILIDLEYYGILNPLSVEVNISAAGYSWSHALFKILMTMLACFAVAFLSSLLSEQARRTKKDLLAMEDHVKRVEKMAAIGEMAAGLAHEIKNPLASLTGSIQMLREDLPYDTDHERLMQIVLREADRLSSLVNDFLLFAKPPAGKVELIELAAALTETIELFEKDRTSQGRITMTKNFIPNVWIEMDITHLRQILWNLLLNAAEAIDGEGCIDVKMIWLKNRYVGIQINDNGCGISKEALRLIFDPFYTTKPNGTGLGLSIVHRILESYKGWLEVESTLEKGTTVTVALKQIIPVT